jgi:hypothetical protein
MVIPPKQLAGQSDLCWLVIGATTQVGQDNILDLSAFIFELIMRPLYSN